MADVTVAKFGELFQTADWKTEKHVPVIECPDKVKAGEMFTVTATIGKEVAHPNKTEHHIRWIELYFHPEGEKFPLQVANCQFTAHGEGLEGPDTGAVHAHHAVTVQMKTAKPGTLYATSYCNIHGLWKYSKEVKLS
ncbi:MAG: class II SORL domain-containing protein [Nitrospirota bacterium]|jgi:superoxide reductase